jgi:hypothetical protein
MSGAGSGDPRPTEKKSLRGAKGDFDGGGDSSTGHEDFAPRRNEANGHGSGVATSVTGEAVPRRNEANGHGGGIATIVPDEATPGRNEANGHCLGVATMVTGEAVPQRNEANGYGGGIATIGPDEATPGRNEANGHGGGTDLAVDTQAEVIERRQVGSATVTRFSLAAGVKDPGPLRAVSAGRGGERRGSEAETDEDWVWKD